MQVATTRIEGCLQHRVVAAITAVAFVISGCAVQPSGAGGSEQTQAGCIAAHIVVGAIVVAAAAAVAADKKDRSKSAVAGAVVGGVAGYAAAWMGCINRFAKPTTVQALPLGATTEYSSYSPQQGTTVRVRSAFLDPAAVSPGRKSELKLAYLVMDPGRDVKIVQTLRYKIILADGQERLSPPSREELTKEPGLYLITLPLEVPAEVVDARLIAMVTIEANGKSAEVAQELLITKDYAKLQLAQTEAVRNRVQFEQEVATRSSARVGGASGSSTQTAANATGSKYVAAIATAFTVTAASANLRDQPSVKGTLVGTLVKGTRVSVETEVNGAEGRWLRIEYNGKPVWVGATQGKAE